MPTTTPARNGVDTEALFSTIDLVASQPELARFQFRANSTWMSGTHTQTTVQGFSGAGQELAHERPSQLDTDHPVVLTGKDNGLTPVEHLLVGLAGCLTAGLANIAAARGVTLHAVEASVEGDIDLQGILGLNPAVRNGYQQIRVRFRIDADASPEKVRALVAQSQARSAVLDVLTAGVPVSVEVVEP